MDWKSSLQSLKDTLPADDTSIEGNEAEASTPDIPVEKARLDIILDKKGRKGKAATIVSGFTLPDSEIEEIARKLKQRLGTGGSSRGGEILIQGDKRRETADALTAMGLKCRII